jgi:tRNA A-37 threonylcarbamoyl transferase component Bud32
MLELLGVGRDADVFALGDDRVLRRYRDGSDATAEADLMRYVGGFGFPVPQVYDATGPDLVLERLRGPTLLDALLAGSVDTATAAGWLSELHADLHALPARTSPADRILHLDLHPRNVMVESRGPVLIDWRNATEGPAGLDVALSALILAQVAVDPAAPHAGTARELLERFAAGHDADHLDQAVARRGADPNLTPAELEQLAEAASLARRLLLGSR